MLQHAHWPRESQDGMPRSTAALGRLGARPPHHRGGRQADHRISGTEDILGKSPFDVFFPDDHEQIRNRIRHMLETGQPVDRAHERVFRLDGSIVDVDVTAVPFTYLGNTAIHLIREAARQKHIAFVFLDQGHGADHVTLARERQFADLFPQCELGAMPPFGNLYGMPVYVALALTEDDSIAFNAGTHRELIRLPYTEYARLVQPTVIKFSVHE